jgi:ribosomal protein S18 acetylase RimI-like enzyme
MIQFAFQSPLYLELLKLRNESLRKPLGLLLAQEEISRDRRDEIYLGLFHAEKGSLHACVILSPLTEHEVKLRQMAVDPQFQRKGLGRLLLKHAERISRERGWTEISLAARSSVAEFYEKLGYHKIGEAYAYKIVGEGGFHLEVPHFQMRKSVGTT